MTDTWAFPLDFCMLGGGLLAATFLRAHVKLLQRLLVPNNIVAGFICLLLGREFVGLIDLPAERLGAYVYHLLAITFIAMGLRRTPGSRSRAVMATGFILSIGYGVQVVIGMTVALVFSLLFVPGLFPTFGYFLMLGFGQGPGQAYSLGTSWESLGFEDAGSIGLTFAAIGYLWASLLGVAIVYRALNRAGRGAAEGISEPERRGLMGRNDTLPEAGRLTTAPGAIDAFSFHLAFVGGVYLFTFGVLKAVEFLLFAGGQTDWALQLVSLVWGLHFIFATLNALLLRMAMDRFGWGHVLDTGLLTRIAGSGLDFMVCAAIAALSLSVFRQYMGPILVMTTLGGIGTALFTRHAVRVAAMSHPIERLASLYGTLTGTLSTGLTLARIPDPHFRTPAPQDLVLGCGLAFPLGAPYLFSFLIPLMGRDQPHPMLYQVGTLALVLVYTAALYAVFRKYLAPAFPSEPADSSSSPGNPRNNTS